MWNFAASYIGGRVFCALSKENNLMHASFNVATSGTPYILQILQIDFPVDVKYVYSKISFPRLTRLAWCLWKTFLTVFLPWLPNRIHCQSQWQHGMQVACLFDELKASLGWYVLGNTLELSLSQLSCIDVCIAFCSCQKCATGRRSTLVLPSCPYDHECGAV